MSIEQRDIVLLPFPFSDQSGFKVRPALVASNNTFNRSDDIIVFGITSNISKNFYTLIINDQNLEKNIIEDSCCIKVENILKIDKKLIIKKLDRLKESDFNKLKELILKIF
ncbi:type II toxin-antitoxin system PemK/MazF family toxin [Candidatus Woesearchaeota archaeon]|nr:type II toxin-antitoxin system PemK/MazF family toxin [Candidatus Woesearchaeota archaeon]HIH25390.1 type II toxin-antitoxin system PemK/MazF family toxin [Nanoarchaeota archaeon]